MDSTLHVIIIIALTMVTPSRVRNLNGLTHMFFLSALYIARSINTSFDSFE